MSEEESASPPEPIELGEELSSWLAFLRKRPELVFGERDHLRHFESMALGYQACSFMHRRWEEKELDLTHFGHWLVEVKGFPGPTGHRWSEIILRQYPDEEEAYQLFFDLLREYRGWPEFKLKTIDPINGTSEPGRYC